MNKPESLQSVFRGTCCGYRLGLGKGSLHEPHEFCVSDRVYGRLGEHLKCVQRAAVCGGSGDVEIRAICPLPEGVLVELLDEVGDGFGSGRELYGRVGSVGVGPPRRDGCQHAAACFRQVDLAVEEFNHPRDCEPRRPIAYRSRGVPA